MVYKFSTAKMTIFCIALLLLVGVVLFYFLKPTFFFRNTEQNTYVMVCEGNDLGCQVKNLPYQNPTLSIEIRVNDLLARMTIAEKIGQMALIEKNSLKSSNDIAKYGLGALLSGGGAKPNHNTPEDWFSMVKEFQTYAQKTRLSIPLFYGIDASHGHSNVYGATIFPHSIGLAAAHDPDLVREVAQATAAEVAATGINWVYSPDLDVPRDLRWGRVYETFGIDTRLVGTLGRAYIEGLQDLNETGLRIAATAKHYIGNGSTEWGSSGNKDFFIDQGDSRISEDEMRRIDLEPFRQAVAADVKSIMVGLNTWNGEKVSFSKHLITDILKGELDFKGFVVSDWYGVYEKENDKYKALVRGVNAGIDMVMLPYDYQFFLDSMRTALASGDIPQTRVDDAVRRILKVKFEIGLFDSATLGAADLQSFNAQSHRELARMAVRKSLVMLKNNGVLPFSKNSGTILVAGSAAHNLGKQSGGWTVEWQGIDGNWIPGTTILKGIQNAVAPSVKVIYDERGDFAAQQNLADIGIAVVGESPYAEGWGDNPEPKLTDQDIQAISKLKKASKKIIVIIISGRPLNIASYVNDWDAIIAAWLPGTEGEGVADVLFGEYPSTGTLPIEWDL